MDANSADSELPQDVDPQIHWTELQGPASVSFREGGDWTTYPHLSNKAEWRQLMNTSCALLERLLLEHGIQYSQCMCGTPINGIADHLLGAKHFRALQGKMKDGMSLDPIRESFKATWNLPRNGGCLEFNHMDGQIRRSGSTAEPSPPYCPPPQSTELLPLAQGMEHGVEADLVCHQYLETVLDLIRKQKTAQDMVLTFLEWKVKQALWAPQHTRPILRLFGSREYDAALPDSDLDVVCDIRLHSRADDDAFLERLCDMFRADARCTSVTPQIKVKHTLRFRMLDLSMDFTVCRSSQEHRPSQATEKVKEALQGLPDCVRNLARLVTSVVKHQGCCSKGRAIIGEKLKSVHFVIIVIAWSKQQWWEQGWKHFSLRSPLELLRSFLSWMCKFEFDNYKVDAFSNYPFTPRTDAAAAQALWICCPLCSSNNLGERVDDASFQEMRRQIHFAATLLQSRPRDFWREAEDRWRYLNERRYSNVLDTAEEAVTCLSLLEGEWFHDSDKIVVSKDAEWYIASRMSGPVPKISYFLFDTTQTRLLLVDGYQDGESRKWKLDGQRSKPKERVVWTPLEGSVSEECWVSADYEELVEV